MTNIKKFKFPFAAVFVILATIGCTVLRYYQYSEVVIIESGFFKYDGGFLNIAYYIAFVAFLFILAMLIFIDIRAERGVIPNFAGKKILLNFKLLIPQTRRMGIVSAIIGLVLFFAAGFLLALEGVAAISGNSEGFGGGSNFGETSISFKIALFAAALGYTYIGFTVISQRAVIPTASIGFLFIAAYNVIIAAGIFMGEVYLHNVSADFIMLSTHILLSLFFLACGRITVQSETRLTAVFTSVFGYSAVLLSFSEGIARIWYYYSLLSVDTEKASDLYFGNNGFDLPPLVFFLQGAVVLWLLFAFSAKNSSDNYGKYNEEDDDIFEQLEKETDNENAPDDGFIG